MATTQAQRNATQKYLKNFDEIKFRAPKGKREMYQELAKNQGKSMTALILELLDKELENAKK